MTGPADREARLDALREEARREGAVAGVGARVAGGPIPPGTAAGYYGRGIVKPPVWTWEVPLYFFAGGAGGMAAVLALAAWATGAGTRLVGAALAVALAGAVVSPILLILDLGRPARFLNMLRVFKRRSAMSVGAWVLAAFGGAVTAAWALHAWIDAAAPIGTVGLAADVALGAALVLGGLLGAVLATYTGVLLGATAIPAWFVHVRSLPLHFGVAGLGSAAAILELLGHGGPALHALGIGAAAIETAFGAWIELRRNGAADRALHAGPAAWLLRGSGLLAGPVSLVLRLAGLVPLAGIAFLAGALLSRYGWVAAGRASALDPEATLATQRG